MRLKTQHADIERGANILSIDIPDQLKQRCKTGIKFIDDAFGGKNKQVLELLRKLDLDVVGECRGVW